MALPFGTYAFNTLVGQLSYPGGTYILAGSKGIGSITLESLTTRATQQKTGDGYVNTSFELGNNARATVEVIQTSDLDAFLRAWANFVDTALVLANSVAANAGSIRLTSILTGETYTGLGVAIEKRPNRGFGANAQMRSWPLLISEEVNQ